MSAKVPETRSTASSGPIGNVRSVSATSDGSSTNDHEVRLRHPLFDEIEQRTRSRPGGGAGDPEREVGVEARRVQRDPQGHGTGERHLYGSRVVGDRCQEGPQTDVRVRREERVEQRRLGVDVAFVEHERSVVGDLDADDARRGLGHHALTTRPGRQRRGERQPRRVAQDELDGFTGVAMRKAADARRQADGQRYRPLVCHVCQPPRSGRTPAARGS